MKITYMHRNILILGEANAVPAHFHDDIFPKHNNLAVTVLDAAGVACESGARNFPRQVLCDGSRDRRSTMKNDSMKSLTFDSFQPQNRANPPEICRFQ